MTAYNYEGQLVDLKGTNLHDSALVADTVEAGVFVKRSGAKVVVADSGALALGISVFRRASGDDRPITYTWFGEVNVILCATVASGDWLEVQNAAGHVGPFANVSGNDLNSNNLRKIVGRAHSSGASGAVIPAHVGGLVLG